MKERNNLSGSVLGQIALMQSVVTQLPDKTSMLKFACQGLRDISGVETVEFAVQQDGDDTASNQPSDEAQTKQTFVIQRNNHLHGALHLHIRDPDAFAPYRPFVENFATMLAVVFEERRQQEINRNLMADLENRVSERTRALERETERLAVTLRSIGDGVITTDTAGNVALMNMAAEALTGWTGQAADGNRLENVFTLMDERTGDPLETPVTRVMTSGKIIELADQTVLRSRDGQERFIALTGAPIKDNRGNGIGVVLVFRDMTEKRKMMDTIQRAAKLDSLGILAGGIAHDFNNLLGGILGFIDMAAETTTDTQVKQYLSRSMQAMERARGLTLQLLTFAKGGTPIRTTEALFPLVEDTTRFALSGSSVTCDFTVSDNLYLCDIDKNQISQVIDNIVINAQQAMPNGGSIHITAQNLSLKQAGHLSLPSGNYVAVSIQDSGIGIPAEILPRIFDPFYTTKTKGHGLGLATTYSIIHRHGGAIEVSSEPGKGSTFQIILPASKNIAPTASAKKAVFLKGQGTILVLDDEEAMRSVMTSMLQSMGFEVKAVGTGKEALEWFSAEKSAARKIAAMIFDLTIPGGPGGKEIIREIRKHDTATPAFVASGYAKDPIMANPADYGFSASISKPFRKRELAEMLQNYLSEDTADVAPTTETS